MGVWATLYVTYSYLQVFFSSVTYIPLQLDDGMFVVHMQFYDLAVQIMPSSWWEDQVTWTPTGSSISMQSLRLNFRPEAVSQKEDTYLQRMAGICSKILRFALLSRWGARDRIHTVFLCSADTTESVGPYSWCGEQLARQLGPAAESSLVLGPTQN